MNDYAIFGSAPMYIHQLRDHIGDLDIIARGTAWVRLQELGKTHPTLYHNGLEIDLGEGKIQAFNKWISDKWDINELIDTAESVDGVRFVQLEKVLEFKQELSRPKDIEDIAKLKAYLLK